MAPFLYLIPPLVTVIILLPVLAASTVIIFCPWRRGENGLLVAITPLVPVTLSRGFSRVIVQAA